MIGRLLAWAASRHDRRKHDAALHRFGWDGICPHCKRWLHTSGHPGTRCFAETIMHWHYRCGDCGGLSHWALWAMLPILDMAEGAKELQAHQAAIDAGSGI